MINWSNLPPIEIERRRLESAAAFSDMQREEFNRWYQAECDRLYWSHGQCCAGCDHWESEAGLIGQCKAAGIVPGEDVSRSLDIDFISYVPKPGLPFTRAAFHCGKFRDVFDWSTLDQAYLQAIGALRHNGLKPKPAHAHPGDQD